MSGSILSRFSDPGHTHPGDEGARFTIIADAVIVKYGPVIGPYGPAI